MSEFFQIVDDVQLVRTYTRKKPLTKRVPHNKLTPEEIGARRVAKETLADAKFAGKTEGVDYFSCRLCGHRGEQLQNHIATGHKVPIAEYKQRFGVSRVSICWNKGLSAETDKRVRDNTVRSGITQSSNFSKVLKEREEKYRQDGYFQCSVSGCTYWLKDRSELWGHLKIITWGRVGFKHEEVAKAHRDACAEFIKEETKRLSELFSSGLSLVEIYRRKLSPLGKPYIRRLLIELFGKEAVLSRSEKNITRNSFGESCLALDGHPCQSWGEQRLDDWLYSHNIQHVPHPVIKFQPKRGRQQGRYKAADQLVGDLYIEWDGMTERKGKAKISWDAKLEHYKKNNLKVLIIRYGENLDEVLNFLLEGQPCPKS